MVYSWTKSFMEKKLIVTHHAPDIDAIGATWLLKKFDFENYANANISFVNPGEKISATAANILGFSLEQVTHVDTGLGKFDHHQPERAHQKVSATSLVFEYLCQTKPELKTDRSLKSMIEYIVDIDHFGDIHWPDPANLRYNFMIHELIRGAEYSDPHNDESQLHFGFTCLDNLYAVLKQHHKAAEILAEKAKAFSAGEYDCLALETRNDDTIKLALKQGYELVIRKDPERGHIRIKARPDSQIELKPLYEKIITVDQNGTWFYHNSGKMLLNGSHKHHNQTPSPLSVTQVIELVKIVYAKD